MDDLKTYTGACHCNKVRFEVQTDLANVISCNCSICSRVGYLLTFVPDSQFKLLSGEAAQTDYQFNKKHIHHVFCSTCGVRCFGYGTGPGGNAMHAINVRTLDDVDIDTLSVKKIDGRST